jgi:hypothetical protein
VRFPRCVRCGTLASMASEPAGAARRRRLPWQTKARINLCWVTSTA